MLSLLCACGGDSDVVYSEFRDLSSDGWGRMVTLAFDPMPTDSVTDGTTHDVEIVVRHTDATPCDTLWIAVEETSFGAVIHNDTIPLPLANHDGEWIGKGAHGFYEVTDTLRSFRRLPSGYQIAVSHAMKPEYMPGIKNVGIKILRR